jgi:hypothetical protein
MAILAHEIWEEPDGDGGWLQGLCLAGPDGEAFRSLQTPAARLVQVFTADSHFEAMTIYHRILGREPYTTADASDHEAYPDAWAERQQACGASQAPMG